MCGATVATSIGAVPTAARFSILGFGLASLLQGGAHDHLAQEIRKCSCGSEFRPKRQAQEYCSPRCRRGAAYGRERFQSETRGPRKRFLRSRVEASDASLLEAASAPQTPSARVVVGSFRKGVFSPTNPVP